MKLKISPHIFFLFASVVLFIVYNTVTPPLQSPDEFDHFRRSYSLSEGHFLPVTKDKRLGDSVPDNFKWYAKPYRLAASNLKYTINDSVAANSSRVLLEPGSLSFEDFPNTSNYSVVSYIPQTLTIAILKPFNPKFGTLYYSCRAVTYFFWVLAFFIFLKIVPVYKWFFTFIALLPMNVYQANSFSADTMTNILAFLFVGFVLKYAFDDKKITPHRVGLLLILAALLALAKVVYVGLILSVFIIPSDKFSSLKQKVFLSSIVIVVAFFCAAFWSATVTAFNLTYNEYNSAYRDFSTISHCANFEMQKQYMLTHPGYLFGVIYRSLFDHPYTYLNSFIGNFGNSDIPLSRSVTLFSYSIIFFLMLFDKSEPQFSYRSKIILAVSAFISFVFLLISQHLTWDCLAEGVVDIVQGRYLTPLLPFVLLLIPSIKKIQFNYFYVPAIVACAFINWSATTRINERYFKDTYDGLTKFYSNTDSTNKKGMLLTTDTAITLEGAGCRKKFKEDTTNLYTVLQKKCPYGYTYKFKNLGYGDLIDLKVDRKGWDITFVVEGQSARCGKFYLTNNIPHHKDTNTWQRIHTAVTITTKCDSATAMLYLWNTDTTKRVMLDNFEISIKRFKDNYIQKAQKRLSLFK